jgi:hypothetical protein
MQQTKRLSLRVLGFPVPAFVLTDTVVLVFTDRVDESLIGVLRRHPRVGVKDVVYRGCLLGSRVVRESQESLQTQAGNCTDVFWLKLSGRRQLSAEDNAHTCMTGRSVKNASLLVVLHHGGRSRNIFLEVRQELSVDKAGLRGEGTTSSRNRGLTGLGSSRQATGRLASIPFFSEIERNIPRPQVGPDGDDGGARTMGGGA